MFYLAGYKIFFFNSVNFSTQFSLNELIINIIQGKKKYDKNNLYTHVI